MKGRFKVGMISLILALLLLVTYDATRPRAQKPLQIKVEIVARATLPGVPARFSELVEWASRDTGLEWQAIAAVAKIESDWDETKAVPAAHNSFDVGLMQINSRYHAWYWATYLPNVPMEPLNAKQSIIVGSRHLAALYHRIGNIRDAVLAYNKGEKAFSEGAQAPAHMARFDRAYAYYKAAAKDAQGVGPCTALIKAPSYASGGAL